MSVSLAADQVTTLLRVAVENSAEAVAFVGADGRVVYANAAAARSLGYLPEEMAELTAFDLEPGLTLPVFIARCDELRRTNGPLVVESQLRARSTALLPVELTLSLARYGAEECGVVVARDLAGQRRALEAIEAAEESERRRAWLLEALEEGVWEWNVRSGVVHFSAQWLESLGYDAALVPHTIDFWESLVHPDDVEETRRVVEAHVKGETPRASVEHRVRTSAGDWRWMLVRGKIVERAEAGDPLRMVGTSTDVSTLKRTEEANREFSQLVSILFDTAPVGIVCLDTDRCVSSWNAAAERILGWTAEEVIGKRLPVVRKEGEADFERHWQEVLQGESLLGQERPAVRKDGSRVSLRLSTVPLHAPDGRFTGAVGLLEDITEQKRLQAQLLQSQRLENIGRLAGAVAHDFNNLLTVINGYSEIALATLDRRDPLHESLAEIKAAGDRAASLTQQLLAFSRRQVMQAKVLDLNEVVGGMETMLRRLIGEDIQLVLAPDPALGRVKADPTQMQQVIMNLAVNARDAMPGGGKLVIETSNVELDPEVARSQPDVAAGPYVLLSVTDTGAGMDEATLNHLFEPFFTTKEKGKGTGLGLSTVYGIVKQSGGHVCAYSRTGHGTSFKVYLPRIVAAEAAAAPAGDLSPVVSGTETILLVEDQAEVRQLTLQALGIYGYHVLAAANGPEALELVRRHQGRIDLVLSDIVMPGMNGPELAKAVSGLRPGIRVVLMSGYSDDAAIPGGTMPAGLDYIQKPFTPDTLARKVRHALDARPASGRILVVDDEPEIRHLLRQFLEHAGYRVTEAPDGKQAVAEVDGGGVSLVITDLVMPEKEGIETIREMRSRHPEVKIIAMSGAFGGRFLRTAEMLGAHATLSKPLRAESVVRAVREVLAH